jgi:choline dehydrogenase-like flavoprotein
MTETMIPRALKAGTQLETGIEVDQLSYQSGYWLLKGIDKTQPDKPFELAAKTVFLSSGAIATPLLLRKSGLSKLAGNTLHMHPSIKLVARFADQVNSADMGVPVHQVKEFSPRFSFGCSISSKPYLTLAMLDIPGGQEIVRSHWQHMAIFYSMVTSGIGSIQHTFLGRDPLVKYNLGKQGIADTLDGLWHLGQCLFAAGAVEIYPVVYGSTAIKNLGDLRRFLYELRTEQLNLMTIHLFSSCPMGEDKQKCVTDSYGKVRGAENLFINDASLLCTALGVNPQGTIMAMVRRNIEHFLTEE